jgi:hypothetical protein
MHQSGTAPQMEREMCILSLLVASTFVWMCLPAQAQNNDPFSIRVESNLVLVNTQVYNWHSANTPAYRQCRSANTSTFDNLPFSEPFTPKECYRDIVLHGLGVNDFHLFEDGVEQEIQSVGYEREPLVSVRDNLRFHGEWSHTPRGKWSTMDLGTGWGPAAAEYFYRLAYVPNKPEEGKCYNIKVKVDRHFAVVYATDQYCYTTNLATDPLDGTKFGKNMETHVNSDKKASIPLSAQAGFFYTNAQSARVDLVLEFPWNRLEHRFLRTDLVASIGVLGMVYKKDRTLATRFSDFGCCSSGTRWFASVQSEAGNMPSRYETQIDLPAGAQYELRVVLSDGTNFGRVVIPVSIDSYDGKQLAISSVVLSNRFRDAKVAAQEAAEVNLAPDYVPLVSKGLQFTPATQTHFKPSDHLTAYFEIYEPLSTPAPATKVQANVKIIDVQTGQTRFQFAPIEGAPFEKPRSNVIAIAGDLPLAQLPKGDYRVEVQATDSAGRTTPMRNANFTIE